MRKGLIGLGLGAALMLSVGAIAAQTDLSDIDPAGQTVVYWHQFSGAQGETIDALIADFNANNEYGITVEGVPQGSYGDVQELMNGAIVSGELPNLVAGYANNAASYAADGAAVDLNPYINDVTYGLTEEETADFNTAALDFNTVDDQLLAFPHQLSAQVMVVNQTLLSELGYDAPPATLEEFREIACASSESTGPNGEDRFGFPITTDASALESFVAAQGGTIYDGEAYTFEGNEALTNTLQLYKDLYDEGCAYIPAERFAEQGDFNLGLNPFFVSSTAGFTFIISGFADSGVEADWVVAPFPRTTENPTLQVFVPSIILVPSTPEQELASYLFLDYLVSPEAAAAWSGGTGYFNPVISTSELLSEESFAFEGLYPYFEQGNTLLNNPDVTLYSSPSVASYGTVRGLLSEAIANVTSNGLTVEEAVATLQAAADEAVAAS